MYRVRRAWTLQSRHVCDYANFDQKFRIGVSGIICHEQTMMPT
jgi:hypothetical protein